MSDKTKYEDDDRPPSYEELHNEIAPYYDHPPDDVDETPSAPTLRKLQQPPAPKPTTTATPPPTTTTPNTSGSNNKHKDLIELAHNEEIAKRQFKYIDVLHRTEQDPTKSKFYGPFTTFFLSIGLVGAFFLWTFKSICRLLQLSPSNSIYSSKVPFAQIQQLFNIKHNIAQSPSKDALEYAEAKSRYDIMLMQNGVMPNETTTTQNNNNDDGKKKPIKLSKDQITASPTNILYQWQRDENQFHDYLGAVTVLLIFPIFFWICTTFNVIVIPEGHPRWKHHGPGHHHHNYRQYEPSHSILPTWELIQCLLIITLILTVIFAIIVAVQYLYKKKYYSKNETDDEKKARGKRYLGWIVGFPIGLMGLFSVLYLVCQLLTIFFGCLEVSILSVLAYFILSSRAPGRAEEYKDYVNDIKANMKK